LGCGGGETGGRDLGGGETGVTDPEDGIALRLCGGGIEEEETLEGSSIGGCKMMSSCFLFLCDCGGSG
jgi:hypothetical protein